jgi:sulfur-oxidizing protein SoxB
LLLDGGDSWQGSATALWTKGEDMRGAQKRLGVDYMTAHWEFTYGQQPIKDSPIPVLAHNVRTADFEDPVFAPYAWRSLNGIAGRDPRPGLPVHADRQPAAFRPRLDLRHPGAGAAAAHRRSARKGAKAVVLLSHNGMDVDLKLAARVRGLDAILGGIRTMPCRAPFRSARRW